MMKKLTFRIWFIFSAICTAIICVLAYSMTMTGAARPAVAGPQAEKATQSSPGPRENYEGIVTDTHCGAKHSAAVGLSAADCTRACVHSGESFALVDGEKTYRLKGDEAALKRVAGERVKLAGTLTDNTISVGSVSPSAP
ncbi:MAG: hypothetical protein WA594_21800 [Candidatus Sulfotelmatobacter sp.]